MTTPKYVEGGSRRPSNVGKVTLGTEVLVEVKVRMCQWSYVYILLRIDCMCGTYFGKSWRGRGVLFQDRDSSL